MDTNLIAKPKIKGINYTQCFKVLSMMLYILSSILCIFLMGYGLETGMNEMSMFVIDMIVFVLLNVCHIGIWNVSITMPDGKVMIMADKFDWKYYLGGVLQNIIYIFFFAYFTNHFFLNSMTFIIICYNFLIYPIYNAMKCMYNQFSKVFYYETSENTEIPKNIEINKSDDEDSDLENGMNVYKIPITSMNDVEYSL